MKRRIWLKAGAAIGVLLLVLAMAAVFCPNQVLTMDSGAVKADVLVVLGGGLGERPRRAAELFDAGEARFIVCTGAGDAAINDAVLVKAAVPASRILLEPDSRTTQENAKFTVAILRARHFKSAIIVTSWYHSRRALACFEHYGPDIKFYSRPAYFGYLKAGRSQRIKHYIKAEYYKTLGYWLCYGIFPMFLHLH